jgi:hypothetical protein
VRRSRCADADSQLDGVLAGFLFLGIGCDPLVSSALRTGPEFAAGALSFGRLSKAPGVSEAPGVPGVRTAAAAEGDSAWPHAIIVTDSARGSTTIDRIDLIMCRVCIELHLNVRRRLRVHR